MTERVVACGFALGLALLGSARAESGKPIVIEHAKIISGNGPILEDGTLVITGSVIEAVGPAAAVRVPPNAVVVDGRGTWVTAGFIDAQSRVGLNEVALEHTTVDTGLDGRYDAVRAAFSAADGFNVHSVVVPVTRLEGITSVVLAPEGGLVSGRGWAADLDERLGGDAVWAGPLAVHFEFGEAGKAAAYGARGGALLRLREVADDVRQYAQRRADYEKNQMRHVGASRLDLEALIPVFAPGGSVKSMKAVVVVHRAADILAVLELAKKERMDLVLSGCEEGWRVAAQIAAAKVPVILKPLSDLPSSFEELGARFDNAALLAKAGVKIAISPLLSEPHNSRTLRIEAGNAVANGLPWEQALAAVTRTPAEIFGLNQRVGTLEPAKAANVVVWSGDPFETASRVKHLFIRGREIPLVSRQTLLRDRYRDLSSARPQSTAK